MVPRRTTGSEFYDILDPVFSILKNHLIEEAEANYIEQLEQYFDFGFPIKLISEKPRKYQLYGGLSVDDETSMLLNDFIEGYSPGFLMVIRPRKGRRMSSGAGRGIL